MRSSWKLTGSSAVGSVAGFAQGLHPVANVFKPLASPAQSIYNVSMLMLAICAAIFFVVGGLLLFTIIRFRQHETPDNREPAQVYGSNRIEIAWTVIPILIVTVLSMATARAVVEVRNKRMPPNALQVTVIGHQWWWEFRYPTLGIITANELHVPVSTTAMPTHTVLQLESVDVAHSFWVPQLAGKVDVIPGVTNTMWFDPRESGTFLGNCAEYCGTQHANMLIRVIVEPAAEFERWAAAQKLGVAPDASPETERMMFLSLNCINCHTVNSTLAQGTFGPNLTHLMSRTTLGSGVIANTRENLRAWIKDPQAVKPGNLMPNLQLNSRELDDVVNYLSSLK